jgi:hypothetical protein
LADQFQLLSHPLVGGNDIVERIGDLASQLGPISREPNRKVAGAHGLKCSQQPVQIKLADFRMSTVDRVDST